MTELYGDDGGDAGPGPVALQPGFGWLAATGLLAVPALVLILLRLAVDA
jgi:hypothetical protein